jgi:protein-L-isoaspartate(D-aspartate) O-methyltransferase
MSRFARIVRETPGVDSAVADAFAGTPRDAFVDADYADRADEDTWLPTGPTTTISQPSYVARVISAARIVSTDRVLEIGTGSGWTAAVVAKIAAEVVTVERVPALVVAARTRLAHLPNVQVVEGDGDAQVDGTFDAILVMAGAPDVPASYKARLRDGGRLVIPVGRLRNEHAVKCRVVRVTRSGHAFGVEDLFAGDWNLLRGKDGF